MTKQQKNVDILPPYCMTRGRVKEGAHNFPRDLYLTYNTYKWTDMVATHGAGLHG